MTEDKGYNIIFKSTFLFGFVQAFNIAVKVILNKVAALFLGSQGVGLIGLYTATIGMLKTGTSLGISQSAVRDISAANEANDYVHFSNTIVTTNRVIIFTAILGIIVTLLISPFLNKWAFGNSLPIFIFIFVALAVALTTLWEGQLAILKGMRRLRLLAKANMIGAGIGLIIALPLYLIFGQKGIVPVLVITPFCALLFSGYYVRKISYSHVKLSYRDLFRNASPMVKMGIALSFATFLSQLSTFIISGVIRNDGGLHLLGFYNAGIMIMVGYFSVIINALTTDYYPRIAAVNNDNVKVQGELNKQSIVSLLLCFPLVVLFLFILPFLIRALYSSEFLPIVNFIRIGIFGTLIAICSNQVDLILVAKNNTKVYTIISVFYRLSEIVLNVFLYKYLGLVGIGISMLIMAIVHLSIMVIVVNNFYSIRFEGLFIKTALIVLSLIVFINLLSVIDNEIIKYSLGFLIFSFSVLFSYYFSKRYLNFDILKIIKK